MIGAVKIGQGCRTPVADALHLTNEDAVAACRNDLFDQTREDGRAVDLRRGTPDTIVLDTGKPILDQMILAAGKSVGKVMPVLRQDVDAKVPIGRDGLGDPAA